MNVYGVPRRTIRLCDDSGQTVAASQASALGSLVFVEIIDQTALPHRFQLLALRQVEDAATAIKSMQVRGAPLIGASAAWGLWLALRADSSDRAMEKAAALLLSTRPTAVNLQWAIQRVLETVGPLAPELRAQAAALLAEEICDEDVAACRAIGEHGLALFEEIFRKKGGEPLRILTHCNAGWLATVDHGTALSPVYAAHDKGIPLKVWVDETRPRNQGASLSAWELQSHGVEHQVIADNAAGHLMQRGLVDFVIVGTDRTTRSGDVCNKIGTYQKALAARDNQLPFYVAAPLSSIDFDLNDGISEIPIEERDPDEVAWMSGQDASGELRRVRVIPEKSTAYNPAFDVTPARLISALITEHGVVEASEAGVSSLMAFRRSASGTTRGRG